MVLKYTFSGLIYITPQDDCQAIVDAMLETNYNGDYCIAQGFEPEFTTRLMEAGFLIMSMNLSEDENDPFFIMLPKLHTVRSALFFENLHIKKSIRRLLKNYELRADAEFEYILDRCVEKHGADWLTPPLVETIKEIRRLGFKKGIGGQGLGIGGQKSGVGVSENLKPTSRAYPASFSLYRDGKLVAGEFGVVCGKVYTSYSGFYDESNTGTVQLILTTRYLQKNGFTFFDMGMPLDYKTGLGAVDISPEEFVRLFRGE